MKQFTLGLNDEYQRPVVKLPRFYGFNALLDTGAVFPVWLEDEQLLKKVGATLLREDVYFGGFEGRVHGHLYQLPHFQLGELIYPRMHIIVGKSSVIFPLILPATMFSHLIYEIDDHNHCLNISIPDTESNIRNLVIKDTDGHLHVACTSAS